MTSIRARADTAVTTPLTTVPLVPVSANEVLRRATVADTGRLAVTQQQVVKQRVRVKRTTRRGTPALAASLEAWKSTTSTYWKAGDSVSAELRERYKSNGLADALPLSPPAVESWVKIAGTEPSALYRSDDSGRTWRELDALLELPSRPTWSAI